MKPARFIDRIVDSAVPVLGAVDRSTFVERLSGTSLTLRTDPKGFDRVRSDGFLFAANLAARLYPQIFLDAPEELAAAAEREIILINPHCSVQRQGGEDGDKGSATLCYEIDAEAEDQVAVFARGLNVFVDQRPEMETPAAPPAALLAACLGISEVFRTVFAAELGPKGRSGLGEPFAFNMITLTEPSELPWPGHLELGEVNLIGVGAIGEAAAKTLACCEPQVRLFSIDHEPVSLSNLQRYVLTRDSDVGAVKVDLLAERLGNTDFEVVPLPTRWSASLGAEGRPTLVALDSAAARIEVQSSLPGSIYNAWTQPQDVGFSRHENFGSEPCLACLYWPDRVRPSRHEQIGGAFNQHPARCLAYLVGRVPVGLPLPPNAIQALAGINIPSDAERWTQTSLLDDIASGAGIDPSQLDVWRESNLADLYQDGVCGGAILDLGIGETPQEALVPLAHQSAFAGIMLATQLIAASVPHLRQARNPAIEGRYDLLAGGAQHMPLPRQRVGNCICSDDVYRQVYRQKFAQTGSTPEPAQSAAPNPTPVS